MANVKFVNAAGKYRDDTARSFGKDQGVRIYHFIITFAAGDVNGMEYIRK